MSSDFCVFTTGTNLDLLRESCDKQGVTLAAYECNPWIGYVTGKLREGVKFLMTRREHIVMWLDGNDSLVLKPEVDILARWQAFGGPMIMSGESTCWPDAELAIKYRLPLHPVGPRFLNAGGFIGPIGTVLTAMHTAIQYALHNEDDQRAWTAAYLANALPEVQLDYSRSLFSSMGDGESAFKADSATKHFNGKIPGREEFYHGLTD